MDILKMLLDLQDVKYGDFQSKLTPGILREKFIGVRVPLARKLGKELIKSDNYKGFLIDLPHNYFEENILHSILISEIKDYEECIKLIDEFLPCVDNWAVCDILSPKVFKRNRDKLIDKIYEWTSINHLYTNRFGIGMLMSHYLNEDFKEEYLKIPASIISDEYYLNTMIAWYFATTLSKQWDKTIPYVEDKKLSPWVHNKTIQKARESFRITNDQKVYLKSLKIK